MSTATARLILRAARLSCFAIVLVGSGIELQAQVAGRVVDELTGRPIAGAQVVVPATGTGTLTSSSGLFRLSASERVVEIEVVMIGYRTFRGEVSADAEALVRLQQRAIELDAFVVTGTPNARAKRELGNTVAVLDVETMVDRDPLGHMESLLGGAVPGVSVSFGGGEVGTGANIRVRGTNSISLTSQPLLYIDGVRVNGDPVDHGGGIAGVGVDGFMPPSRLNDINPEDIESVEILRGPSAATLYGTEASNGVINVITKRGDRGDARLTMTIKQGGNWLPDPESFFPETHFICSANSTVCTPGEVTAFNVLREDRLRNGNVWFRTGHTQGYSGSVSGGTDRVRYYFSADWDRDEGIVDYNWQNQLRGRANLNWTPRADLDMSLGLSSVRSTLQSASAKQPVSTSILFACAAGCEEGSSSFGRVDGPVRGYASPAFMPEAYAEDVEGFQRVNRTGYTLSVSHRPAAWISQRIAVGAEWTITGNSELFRPNPGHGVPLGQKSVLNQSSRYVTVDYSVSGTAEVTSEMESTTSLGFQYYQKSFDWTYAMGRDFPASEVETIGAGAVQEADEGFVENKTVGLYAQQQIAWRDQLYLTGALRGDDNSAFGANYDFVLYPKVSASWVATEASLFDGLDWLNELRLRAAWGQAGQQPDAFAAIRTYEAGVGDGGTPVLRPANLGNPDLEPEVGSELEIGFDASVLDDRVGIEATFYSQRTSNAIIPVQPPPSSGFSALQLDNIAEISNRGFELGMSGRVIDGESTRLSVSLVMAVNRNRVEDLGDRTAIGTQLMHVEGYPVASLFMPRVVSAELVGEGPTARAVNIMCEGGALIPGTTDLSAGGGASVPCSEAPRVFRSSLAPTRDVSIGATLTLFGDVDVFASADYQGGHGRLEGNLLNAFGFGVLKERLEGDDPILLGYVWSGNGFAAAQYDASFARLRRLGIAWRVPRELASRIGAESLTLNLTARNPWMLWQATDELFGYPVLDPEHHETAGGAFGPPGSIPGVQEGWTMTRRLLLSARVVF